MVEKDEVIKLEIAHGSEYAFSILYDEYVNLLFNYGRQITDQEHLIEDSIQEVFLTIWNGRQNLEYIRSLKAYLMTCFRRSLMHNLKSEKRRSLFQVDIMTKTTEASIEMTIVDSEAVSDRNLKLKEAVSKLGKRQQEVLFLIYHDSLTYEDAAKVMNLSTKTLYNLVYEAMKKLKSLLLKNVIFISFYLLSVIDYKIKF